MAWWTVFWSCVSSRCLCPKGEPRPGRLGLQIVLTYLDGPRSPMSTHLFPGCLRFPLGKRNGEGRYLGKAAESRRTWEDLPGTGSWGLRRTSPRHGFRFLLLKSHELGDSCHFEVWRGVSTRLPRGPSRLPIIPLVGWPQQSFL